MDKIPGKSLEEFEVMLKQLKEEEQLLEMLDTEPFEDTLKFLDEMSGMQHIKEKLLRLGRYVQWCNKQDDHGIDISNYPDPNLAFIFMGDPGTGKTTVARQMGRILHSLGLLTTGKVYEYRREDLMGETYGSQEIATKEALEKSKGGVLFLDEAYQCFKGSIDRHDPAYHILETLMSQFDENDRCIIMAGYKSEMQELFKVNPGFRSRIPDDNIIEFTGPTEQMLMDVATKAFSKMHFHIAPDAQELLRQHIHAMWTSKDKDFGNARSIRQLTDSMVINHANRMMTTNDRDDHTITTTDIQQSISHQQTKSPTRSRIGFV